MLFTGEVVWGKVGLQLKAIFQNLMEVVVLNVPPRSAAADVESKVILSLLMSEWTALRSGRAHALIFAYDPKKSEQKSKL